MEQTQLADMIKAQSQQTAVTAKFMAHMGFGQPVAVGGASRIGIYDSLVADASQNNINLASLIPQALLDLRDTTSKDGFSHILDSINTGVIQYRNANGGSMPNASLVASALCQGARIHSGLTHKETGGVFDSAMAREDNAQGFYDSVSAGGHSHTAEVPSLAMVTISQTIANALPIISYLPNIKGTNTVPLVYVRQVAGTSYGKTRKGEYLDGTSASKQYFDNVHTFTATPNADRKTFTVTAVRSSEDQAGYLPIVLGASAITVGGIFVGHDEQSNMSGGKTTGEFPIHAYNSAEFEIKGVKSKVDSGSKVVLDTSVFTIKFTNAIPVGVDVEVSVVANFEVKDANTGKPVLLTPNADTENEYAQVSAYPIRALYTATIDAVTQMQNEFGIDIRASFVAVAIGKLMFEQNIRLLTEASKRAKGLGLYREVDLSRGSDLTQAYNKTADLASELIPAVEDAKRRIVAKANHTPSGFDIFVTGSMATIARSMADDTNFVPTTLPIGLPNGIVRIGSRGSDNYYYIPEGAEVLGQGEIEIVVGKDDTDPANIVDITETVTYGDMLIIARNEIAAKSVMIGHVAVPVVTEDVRENKFESGVAVYTRQACQLNRNERFGSQVSLLRVVRLPKVLSTELSETA